MFKKLLPLLLCLLLLCGCTAPQSVFTVEQDGMTFTVNTKNGTVSDGTHAYDYIINGVATENHEQRRITIIYPDQSQYEWNIIRNGSTVTEGGTGSDGYAEGCYVPGETLAKAILQARDMIPEDPTNWGQIWGGIALAVMGLVNFCFPELLWHMKYWLVVEGGEPSDTYIGICKIGGVVALFVGLILLLMGIL